MSELRVDNIVSADGSAAPIYSKGMNIGAGVTLTNNGNFVVGGATSIAGNVNITAGITTVGGAASITGNVYISGITTVGNNLVVTGNITNQGTFTNTGTFSYTNLDVTGNATIGGNLTVNGTTTTIDTVNLVVEDKNIGIGTTSTASNTTADGGGITIFGGSDGDKQIIWDNASKNWVLVGGGLSASDYEGNFVLDTYLFT
jgi:hypothetical protein